MIFFATLFTVLLAAEETDCADWCANHTGEWESKCAFTKCYDCTECWDPLMSVCPDWCQTGQWETMCGFTKCQECDECVAQPLCANWCVSKDTIEWSTKCQWQNCEGCSQCVTTTEEVVTTTEEVVTEGCTLAIREQSVADLQATGCFCDTFSGSIITGTHEVDGAWFYDGVLPCKVCSTDSWRCAECHAGATMDNGQCRIDNNPCNDNPCDSGKACLVDDYVNGAWTYSCITRGEGLDD